MSVKHAAEKTTAQSQSVLPPVTCVAPLFVVGGVISGFVGTADVVEATLLPVVGLSMLVVAF